MWLSWKASPFLPQLEMNFSASAVLCFNKSPHSSLWQLALTKGNHCDSSVCAPVSVCACACEGASVREITWQSERGGKRDIGVGVCDTSSLHIWWLQLMHKWGWVSSTHCFLIGVCVRAWESGFCQPAFVCVSAHVSLFKPHACYLVPAHLQGWAKPSQFLEHCYIYGASIRPQPCHPPPPLSHHPFVFLLSPPSFCGLECNSCKRGPTRLSAYRDGLYTAYLSVM